MIIKIKRIILTVYKCLRYFNFNVCYAKIKCILSNDSLKATIKKYNAEYDFLKKRYQFLIDKYNNEDCCSNVNNEKELLPIWVFWWQGLDKMPPIIKSCYDSKIAHSNGHPIILLTEDNYSKYVEFPKFILKQLESGQLRIQHFADMLRIKLLREYGGMWMDASIYCNRDIPEDFFDYSVFSLKNSTDNPYFISNDKWTTFLIGGHSSHPIFEFIDDIFMDYCKNEKPFIDYFMFDEIIALAYNNINIVKRDMDIIPFCKGDYRWLSKHIKSEVTDELLLEMKNNNSVFYKIPWKMEHCGDKSFFEYIAKEKNNG
jgi:mannosyltransferase OCH1-like enzyme